MLEFQAIKASEKSIVPLLNLDNLTTQENTATHSAHLILPPGKPKIQYRKRIHTNLPSKDSSVINLVAQSKEELSDSDLSDPDEKKSNKSAFSPIKTTSFHKPIRREMSHKSCPHSRTSPAQTSTDY